jgi:sugar (pentulose or hexulose) kinase
MSVKKNIDRYVIGLDSGTSGTKVLVLDRTGKVVADAHEKIPLFSPQPNYYEQDANDWWISAQNGLRRVTRTIGSKQIAALAISNQRETFVALSHRGMCLRPAIIWLDERCKNEVEPFARKIGKTEIHRISGKPVDYAPVVYRLAWMRKHEPDLFCKISMICDVHTWLVWKMSGTFKTSWASADPLGLYDLKSKRWSSRIIRALKLTTGQLPQAVCPGTILGLVTEKAANFTGLSMGTPVVAGGGDGQAAGLGVNVLTTERAYLNLGTAVVLGTYGHRYRTGNAFRTMSACAEDGYYYECSLRAGTFALDWFIKNILNIQPARQPGIYELLEREARQVPPGSGGLLYLPYICGVMNPYWDINAAGAFTGLSAAHRRGHIYRSILEGIAFEQALAIHSVEETTGETLRELSAIGGGARSDFWCHILADVTGKRICLPRSSEASALGAGIAAAVGAGWYPTFRSAAREMTAIKKVIRPNRSLHKKYQQLLAVYKNIYPALKSVRVSVQSSSSVVPEL